MESGSIEQINVKEKSPDSKRPKKPWYKILVDQGIDIKQKPKDQNPSYIQISDSFEMAEYTHKQNSRVSACKRGV
jgi:hypothetical protein